MNDDVLMSISCQISSIVVRILSSASDVMTKY